MTYTTIFQRDEPVTARGGISDETCYLIIDAGEGEVSLHLNDVSDMAKLGRDILKVAADLGSNEPNMEPSGVLQS